MDLKARAIRHAHASQYNLNCSNLLVLDRTCFSNINVFRDSRLATHFNKDHHDANGQQVSHRSDCPANCVDQRTREFLASHFAVHPDEIDDFDLGPSVLLDRVGVLPCLTTPSESPKGRPAPRSSKGKVDGQTQERWLQDNRSYAPWHYQDMFTGKSGAYRLATAGVKEQLHHLPCGWTRKLRDKARHRAFANGWRRRAAKLFFLFGFASTTKPVGMRCH